MFACIFGHRIWWRRHNHAVAGKQRKENKKVTLETDTCASTYGAFQLATIGTFVDNMLPASFLFREVFFVGQPTKTVNLVDSPQIAPCCAQALFLFISFDFCPT